MEESIANQTYFTVTEIDYTTLLWSSATEPTKELEEGIPYYHRIIVASCCCLITVLSIFGNSLVVAAVVISKKLQTTTNILVVNLTVADFLTCLILPFMAVGLIDGGGEFPLPETICAIVAGVNMTCIGVSVLTLTAIAFVRWYVISKSIRGHQGFHTPRKIGILAVGIWVVAIACLSVPLSLGIGEIGYSRYYSLCSVTDTNPLRFYLVVFQAGVIFVALIITATFYVLIIVHVIRQTRRFRKQFGDDGRSAEPKATNKADADSSKAMHAAFMKREFEITKNLFIVVCLFTLCITPGVVNFFIPGRSVLTLYGAMIMAANSAVNPIIYALKHPNFQEAFKTFIFCRMVDNIKSSTSKTNRSTGSTNLTNP